MAALRDFTDLKMIPKGRFQLGNPAHKTYFTGSSIEGTPQAGKCNYFPVVDLNKKLRSKYGRFYVAAEADGCLYK